MKHLFFLAFLIVSFIGFSQQKIIKKLDLKIEEVSILSFGLDNIIIINSDSNQIEIELLDENSNDHQIVSTSFGASFKLSFKLQPIEEKKEIFRKFITKRLNRVHAIIKIPKHKSITIFGKHIDINSKSYHGNLKIYIDKGKVALNEVKKKVEVRLFDGNVFAKVMNVNIDVTSNNGTILINEKKAIKNYIKKVSKSTKELVIKSINANIKLTTL